ncbi:hypothetical protein N656DRAFT_186096 [Canariomyces notabilis]|uniref:Uncharacterized protein n=1 Tax=Canariomyces notabilis TaxID=2074819 RepID=A0AAN6TB29_9PEZI|nr:hypothetical protein N656DRAFT_186096 [Canariomyces arenarius]
MQYPTMFTDQGSTNDNRTRPQKDAARPLFPSLPLPRWLPTRLRRGLLGWCSLSCALPVGPLIHPEQVFKGSRGFVFPLLSFFSLFSLQHRLCVRFSRTFRILISFELTP